MNRIFKLTTWAAALMAVAFSVQSCDDDDDVYYYYGAWMPNAIVTVKPLDNGSCYMQLDDSTTLLPVNVPKAPYGDKEVRALVNFQPVATSSASYDKAVYINAMDSILTKQMAPNLGDEENDRVYGNDPVDIVHDWVTISEDGYLTLHFRAPWTLDAQPHFVNLISTDNPEDPYELEFRHNAYGDTAGHEEDGLVAFRLDSLPDTEGQTVKLTLKWRSDGGEESMQFDYCTRKNTVTATVMSAQPGMKLQ